LMLHIECRNRRLSMQNEANVEGKCNIGCPFGKAVMQRVIKYWLCM